MLFSNKKEWANNINHEYATPGLAFKGICWEKRSSQSQRLHYCMTPFMRYSGIELSGFGIRWSLTQGVLGGNEMTVYLHCGGMPEIYACMKTHRPVYHHHYQTLLYANLGDIAPWLFWSLDLLWSNKAGTWVTSHSGVCSLIAENTKVPPPGHHRCCSLVWQSALTGYPLGAMQSARQPGVGMEVQKMEKVYSSLLWGFVTQLDEWKTQIPNSWRTFNSSCIWKTIYFHAHILQIRKLRLEDASWFADLETGTQACRLTQIHVLSITVDFSKYHVQMNISCKNKHP